MKSKLYLFKQLYEDYRARIENMISGQELTTIFNDISSYEFMKSYINKFKLALDGGKRMRAFLVLLGYNICGHQLDENIILASLSYELFQNGVLIHDDIIDKSDLRRNRPSMHVALGDDQTGISKAICLGDLGVISASDTIFSSKFDSSLKLKALVNQNKIFRLTLAGELKDIELSIQSEYSIEEIISMYELKTAWYSFIGPIQLGMILGGSSDSLLKQAEAFGKPVGIAFQINDDLKGIYGMSEITGKSSLTDIKEGKKTILTCYFTKQASASEIMKFNSI